MKETIQLLRNHMHSDFLPHGSTCIYLPFPRIPHITHTISSFRYFLDQVVDDMTQYTGDFDTAITLEIDNHLIGVPYSAWMTIRMTHSPARLSANHPWPMKMRTCIE